MAYQLRGEDRTAREGTRCWTDLADGLLRPHVRPTTTYDVVARGGESQARAKCLAETHALGAKQRSNVQEHDKTTTGEKRGG